jgi:hypothetical protein
MTTLLESDMGPMDIGSNSLVINETSRFNQDWQSPILA